MNFKPAPTNDFAKTVDIAALPARSLRYRLRYYGAVLRGMLRPHRIDLAAVHTRYHTSLRLTEQDLDAWRRAFDAESGAAHDTPFSWQSVSTASMLLRICADLGLNFRHLLHMKVETDRSELYVQPGEDYTIEATIQDIVPLGDDRAAAVFRTVIRDRNGNVRATTDNTFAVMNLTADDISSIEAARSPDAKTAQELGLCCRGPARIKRDFQSVSVAVKGDMGVTYGRVSGDPNGMHTTHLGARLFGHERPFVQGLCTMNLVLKALTEARVGTMRRISIQFIRKAYTGQSVEIRFTNDRYEVRDEDGKILATGSYAATAAASSSAKAA